MGPLGKVQLDCDIAAYAIARIYFGQANASLPTIHRSKTQIKPTKFTSVASRPATTPSTPNMTANTFTALATTTGAPLQKKFRSMYMGLSMCLSRNCPLIRWRLKVRPP